MKSSGCTGSLHWKNRKGSFSLQRINPTLPPCLSSIHPSHLCRRYWRWNSKRWPLLGSWSCWRVLLRLESWRLTGWRAVLVSYEQILFLRWRMSRIHEDVALDHLLGALTTKRTGEMLLPPSCSARETKAVVALGQDPEETKSWIVSFHLFYLHHCG